MTAIDLFDIRTEHHAVPQYGDESDLICVTCFDAWPCATATLCDEVARLSIECDEAREDAAARKARAGELLRDRDRQAQKKQRLYDERERFRQALRALVGEGWHTGTAVGLTQANVDAARQLLRGESDG